MSDPVGEGVSAPVTNERRRTASEANGWRWLPLAVGVIVLDQATKAWMVQHFRIYESVHLLPVLEKTGLAYATNPGNLRLQIADIAGEPPQEVPKTAATPASDREPELVIE